MTTTLTMPPLQRAIEAALDWRYAVKKYDPARQISAEDWAVLKQTLRKSPSAYGLQPWLFLEVETPALREQLRLVSWNQSQVVDASRLVVLLARDSITEEDVARHLGRVAEVRGVALESLARYREMMIAGAVNGFPASDALAWTQRQVYIAMGFLLKGAALLEIDATPMEGFDPAAYDRLLELEGTGWRSTAVVALGYRHHEDANQALKKVRFAEEDLFIRK